MSPETKGHTVSDWKHSTRIVIATGFFLVFLGLIIVGAIVVGNNPDGVVFLTVAIGYVLAYNVFETILSKLFD